MALSRLADVSGRGSAAARQEAAGARLGYGPPGLVVSGRVRGARRVLADDRLWTAAFLDRFTAEVERVGASGVALEPCRALVAEALGFVTHPRATAAAKAAIPWAESARTVDNIALTEAERLLRGIGYPALADRVRQDVASVKALGHSGPIRERRAKGIPLPPPTRWRLAGR